MLYINYNPPSRLCALKLLSAFGTEFSAGSFASTTGAESMAAVGVLGLYWGLCCGLCWSLRLLGGSSASDLFTVGACIRQALGEKLHYFRAEGMMGKG